MTAASWLGGDGQWLPQLDAGQLGTARAGWPVTVVTSDSRALLWSSALWPPLPTRRPWLRRELGRAACVRARVSACVKRAVHCSEQPEPRAWLSEFDARRNWSCSRVSTVCGGRLPSVPELLFASTRRHGRPVVFGHASPSVQVHMSTALHLALHNTSTCTAVYLILGQ